MQTREFFHRCPVLYHIRFQYSRLMRETKSFLFCKNCFRDGKTITRCYRLREVQRNLEFFVTESIEDNKLSFTTSNDDR
ncbi:unnamed protein product [Rhizophagus irregularis]|nr:unnamed protein product [Rhizophagus irregularis]